MLDRKLTSDVVFGYGAQALGFALGFAFMTLVTARGGIATWGLLAILVALSGVFTNLLTFRTNEAIIAFFKRSQIEQHPGRGKFALLAGIGLDCIAGAVVVGLFALCTEPIARWFADDPALAPHIATWGWVMAATLMRGAPVAYLQCTERFKLASALGPLDGLIKLGIAAALSLETALALPQVVGAVAVAAVTVTAIAYLPLLKALVVDLRRVSARGTGIGREYVRFSLNTFASSTLKAGNQHLDTVIVGALAGPQGAGIYGTFRQFLSPISFLTGPLINVTYPRFVSAAATAGSAAVRSAIRDVNGRLLKAYVLAVVVIFPAFVLYARLVDLPLAAEHYLAFTLLALATLANGQLWWSRGFSNAFDPNLSLFANLLATVFLLATLYPATLALGLAGAAGGMLTLSMLLTAYWARALERHR